MTVEKVVKVNLRNTFNYTTGLQSSPKKYLFWLQRSHDNNNRSIYGNHSQSVGMSPKCVPSLFSKETSLHPSRCFVELQILSIVWALYKYNKWLATSSYFHVPWNGERSPLLVLSFAIGIQSDTHRHRKMFRTSKVALYYNTPIYVHRLLCSHQLPVIGVEDEGLQIVLTCL